MLNRFTKIFIIINIFNLAKVKQNYCAQVYATLQNIAMHIDVSYNDNNYKHPNY